MAMKPESEWNIESLKHLIETGIASLKELLELRMNEMQKSLNTHIVHEREAARSDLTAAKEAIKKAELATEARFESVNEFRAQLSDQAHTFARTKEVDSHFDAIDARYFALADRVKSIEARREGLSSGWVMMLGVLSLIGMILGIIGFFR